MATRKFYIAYVSPIMLLWDNSGLSKLLQVTLVVSEAGLEPGGLVPEQELFIAGL